MARAFDESEQQAVAASLIEAGCLLFGAGGFSRTSVDDVVSRAGVAKGTFYRFWDSKEAFFFACLEETELQVQEKVIAPILASGKHPADALGDLLEATMNGIEGYPLVSRALDPVLLRRLARKLPAGTLESHRETDRGEFAEIAESWDPERFDPGIDPEVMDGLFKGLLMMSAHREIVGEDLFPKVAETTAMLLAEGLKAVSEQRIRKRRRTGRRKPRRRPEGLRRSAKAVRRTRGRIRHENHR